MLYANAVMSVVVENPGKNVARLSHNLPIICVALACRLHVASRVDARQFPRLPHAILKQL